MFAFERKMYTIDQWSRRNLKLKSAQVYNPTIPFLLTSAQMQLFTFINSGFCSLHNHVLSPTQSPIFCPFCTFRLFTLLALFLSIQHPIILYSHLPTLLTPSFAFYPPHSFLLSCCPLLPLALRWNNPCHIVTLQEFRC